MAEFQVTHDGISKEDKEKAIEDYLKKHGLFIIDAPKVHHREANIMEDDIRYPLIEESDLRKNTDNETDLTESKTIFDYDNLEELPIDTLSHDHDCVKIVKHKPYTCEDLPSQCIMRSGLVSYAIEKKSYTLGIVRPNEGVVDITISQGDIISIVTYDGGSFKIYRGRIHDIVTLSVADRYSTMRIILDTSSAFESEINTIDVNMIVDVREKDYVYDLSIYGVDIHKIYTDWVQYEMVKKPNTIAPTDNIKYTRPLPPISGDFSNICTNIVTIKFNIDYSFTLITGERIERNAGDVIEIYTLAIDDKLCYGHLQLKDGKEPVFYEIPRDYKTRYVNVSKPVFTHLLYEETDYSVLQTPIDCTKCTKIDISNKLKESIPYFSLAEEVIATDDGNIYCKLGTTLYYCQDKSEYYIAIIKDFKDDISTEYAIIPSILANTMIS